ncbi:MAG TPA: 3-dehydroquinate synthase [Turneriella sp.]|nr:3-dehydroquinate synthase [Turneriella sp.]
MAIKPIRVNLAERSYEVTYAESFSALKGIRQDNQFVLIDARVDRLHGSEFRRVLKGTPFLRIPSGESSKNFALLEKTANELVRLGANRKSTLIAIGGGVVGDFTGFLAAIFMRGIKFIQVPTTLLAMVDSSVGGKTAVNIRAGKNLMGVFHQPAAVYILPAVLKTLPPRELGCGLAESIKTALIADEELCRFMENHDHDTRRFAGEFLARLSAECIAIKARIVEEDEKEQSVRAFLNFGHTLAHALEARAGYAGILHGEAVSIGMRFAALLSRRLGFLPGADETRIDDLLKQYALPGRMADFMAKTRMRTLPQARQLVQLMRADKKNDSGSIRYVLLDGIGRARLPQAVAEKELLASLKEFQTLA